MLGMLKAIVITTTSLVLYRLISKEIDRVTEHAPA